MARVRFVRRTQQGALLGCGLPLSSRVVLVWLARAIFAILGLLWYSMMMLTADEALLSLPMSDKISNRWINNTMNVVTTTPRDTVIHSKLTRPIGITSFRLAKATSSDSDTADNLSGGDNISPTDVIGFAVTITGCGGNDFPIEDAASILQFALKKCSIHGSGRYDFVLYAIYHPDAEDCARPLEKLGYTLLKRETPVKVDKIQSDFLREKIETNGCCGAKELIKLEAFSLTQHKVVVLLDLDVVVLRPLDPLFDFMLYGGRIPRDHFQTDSAGDYNYVSILYTLDYNMVNPERRIKPIQGGLVILKPNLTIYDDMVNTVLTGNYNDRGWGGKSGKFWGSMTWQGLLPYYYHVLHRNQSVELNRCIHDNMVQDPRFGELRTRRNETERKCYTDTCEDCRLRPIQDIYSAHFTSCYKPWNCPRMMLHDHREAAPLCRQLHHAWFRLRSEMEASWGRTGVGDSKEWAEKDHFYGYCANAGKKNYLKIQAPFGKPL